MSACTNLSFLLLDCSSHRAVSSTVNHHILAVFTQSCNFGNTEMQWDSRVGIPSCNHGSRWVESVAWVFCWRAVICIPLPHTGIYLQRVWEEHLALDGKFSSQLQIQQLIWFQMYKKDWLTSLSDFSHSQMVILKCLCTWDYQNLYTAQLHNYYEGR